MFLGHDQNPRCIEVIKESWRTQVQGSPMFQLAMKLSKSKKELQGWNHSNSINYRKEMIRIEGKIYKVQQKPHDPANYDLQGHLLEQLLECQRKGEVFWKQKARAQYFKEGDQNTRYFHLSTIQRRQKNRVLKIKDLNGDWLEEEDDIQYAFKDFYQKLYTSKGNVDWGVHLNDFHPQISVEENLELTRTPTSEEITQVGIPQVIA